MVIVVFYRSLFGDMRFAFSACGREFADNHTDKYLLYSGSIENTRTAGYSKGVVRVQRLCR